MIDPQKLETLGYFAMKDIMPLIGLGKPKIILECSRGRFKVKASSLRMETFRLNHICVFCKKEGNIWALNSFDNLRNPHLNLFHIKNENEIILITRDHIKPLSKGGADTIENSQCLCAPCNSSKGNKYPYP